LFGKLTRVLPPLGHPPGLAAASASTTKGAARTRPNAASP
jgi:hypothetical protein